MQKIRLSFFGGAFNPPINTHLQIAENLIKENIVDKVIFVPVGDYYKKQDLVSAEHRYNMLKLACEQFKEIDVEDIAVLSTEMLYAADTFKLICNKYEKEADIFFIMGSDNFNKMPTWKEYTNIINKYNYIIIEREKDINHKNSGNITYHKINEIEDITSTAIRNKIAKGEDVSKYIKPAVLKYIQDNKLYNT